MSQHLDNALHGLQEARCALMLETGDTPEQIEALEAMQQLLNDVEARILVMEPEK